MSSSPTETPSQTAAGFDPIAFWILHRSKVLVFAGLFVVALGAFGIVEWQRRKAQAESEQLLAAAKNADGYRALIAKYPASVPAASAMLLLAQELRMEAKYDESSAQLRAFLEKFPQHPLASGALTSLAATQEAQGHAEEALATYQRVVSTYPTSFSAPVALLAQARLLRGQGKTDDARRIYEQVIQQYQGTGFGQEAVAENQKLTKSAPAPLPTAPPVAPAPVPASK